MTIVEIINLVLTFGMGILIVTWLWCNEKEREEKLREKQESYKKGYDMGYERGYKAALNTDNEK